MTEITGEKIDELLRLATEDHKRGCEGRNYTCTCGYDDRVRAALSSPARSAEGMVTVKPLEWELYNGDKSVGEQREHYGFHPFGYYVATKSDDAWNVGTFTNRGKMRVVSFYGTLADVKAAAQADYETHITSALSLASRVQELEKENARLQAIVAGCDWYWPEGDTSSDACADGPWQLAENWDVKPGDIFAYSRGGVVETRYFGFLPPVDDAESDDNFEIDEPTEEMAKSKILAEVERRAALTAKESDQ